MSIPKDTIITSDLLFNDIDQAINFKRKGDARSHSRLLVNLSKKPHVHPVLDMRPLHKRVRSFRFRFTKLDIFAAGIAVGIIITTIILSWG